MATTTAVPSSDTLEVADYKYGSFSSDLDGIETSVRDLLNPMTPEQYLALEASGELEAFFEALPSPTAADLAPLLLFAANVQSDARELLDRAANLLSSVLALTNSVRERPRDSVIAEWHREAASDYGRDPS